MTIGPGHYAVLSALVFVAGAAGVVSNRHGIAVLTSVAVLLLAPVIALTGFTELGGGEGPRPAGEVLALVAVVAIAADLAVGGGVLALLWRRRHHSVDVDHVDELRA